MVNIDFFYVLWYDKYKHGRVFVDNKILTIYQNDIELAQSICSSISDNDTRNRAVANVIAVELAAKFFKEKGFEIDTATGLHNIPNVLENIDIADIYIDGSYIDVRVYFSEDEISVPKLHFDLGLKPVAYMFIKLEQDLSGYQIAGFIRPNFVIKNNLKDNYYYINENDLSSFYDIESLISTVTDTFNGSRELLYDFVDGSIDESNIIDLLNILTTSANARRILLKAFKAQSVFKFISVSNDNNDNESDASDLKIEDNDENTEDKDYEDSEISALFDDNENEADEISDNSLLDALEYSTEVTPSDADIISDLDDVEASTEGNDQIDSLFTGEQEGIPISKKKSPIFIVAVLLIVLLAALSYLGITKLSEKDESNALSSDSLPSVNREDTALEANSNIKQEAMPNETVDSTLETSSKEESSSIAIPAIEQHLDASVLVSNLKVDWEVPAGYVSNTAAKRYLIKLGKVIQLNLKSELLLLNKLPISNKITVELTYNKGTGKFEAVGIKETSGEQAVDKVILQTIQSALNLSISSNTESFGRLQGNPVLIIHL